MAGKAGKPRIVKPASRVSWRSWLERNCASSPGVWLVVSKKGAARPRVLYEEAVEEALCFGWIDSKPNRRDEESFLLWMAPRKKGSVWSRINKGRVRRLAAAGLMTPAGLAKIKEAKRDGSWSSIDNVEALEVPKDFRAALATRPEAGENFRAFPASSRKIILFWIQSAKRPATRRKRIAQAMAMAEKNLRANHFRQ